MEEQKIQKAAMPGAKTSPDVTGDAGKKRHNTMLGSLNIAEVLEAVKYLPGRTLGPELPPAAGPIKVDSLSEDQPAHGPFFGGNLITPDFIKMMQDFARSQPAKPGEPLSKNQPSTQTPPPESGLPAMPTADVVASFMKVKLNKGVKESSTKTYLKRFKHFEKRFPMLPGKSEPLMDYLGQFDGPTGRHRRNMQDLLIALYAHAVKCHGLKRNPLLELERPLVRQKSIRTLSLEQVGSLLKSPKDLMEEAAAELLTGHGWRQIEVRRILAADVMAMSNGLIQVRGKERLEMAPILPRIEANLRRLAEGLKPEDHLFVARRTRGGRKEPLGEDGMRDLIKRLFERAGLGDFAGHDLRRTFATLVRRSSGDEFLAMRLLRDRIPGVGSRYIMVGDEELVEALNKHSPMAQLEKLEQKQPEPKPKKNQNTQTQITAVKKPEKGPFSQAQIEAGGDGGGLNSPSKRSCPEPTTSLVNVLISSERPLMTESEQTSRLVFHSLYQRPGYGTSTLRHPIPTR